MDVFRNSSRENRTGDKYGQLYEGLYLERDSSNTLYEETDGYYYFGDVTNLQKPWITEPSFIPMVVVYSLAFLVGTVGNLIVICTILKDYKQRTNTTMFLVSLAVSDILFLSVCVPYETTRHFTVEWNLGNIFCKFSGFIEMMTALLTVLNLSVVSVERYVAIVHPLRSRYMCTIGNLKKLIPSVWILAAVLSSPTFCVMLPVFSGSNFTIFSATELNVNSLLGIFIDNRTSVGVSPTPLFPGNKHHFVFLLLLLECSKDRKLRLVSNIGDAVCLSKGQRIVPVHRGSDTVVSLFGIQLIIKQILLNLHFMRPKVQRYGPSGICTICAHDVDSKKASYQYQSHLENIR
ncbi:hypothetical protein CHS0354_042089 [Potamilus streckersoni]|uniref:G-protein coupled receptors family 1 profile domain-containing protein n=1 Tax=Potamilus streckersoni TaxID=2493646 RepID=A0AAE0WHK8_9BIVA|nr:hypothetical protein CHS0354_042089 [Potamilus streckersoni]